MKKFLVAAVMAVMAFTASAQVEEGTRFGVTAGVGLSKVTGNDIETKMAFGYNAGVVLEYNFSEKLYIGSGLNLQNKGWKEDGIDGAIHTLYATLPIHIGTRFAIGDSSYLFMQAGPQIGYGITGSEIEIYGEGTLDYSDYGERFEVAAGAKVGVEFGPIQIHLSGNYGITEATKMGGHNLDFNAGLTYFF